jgi:hypothetical protein
MRVPPLTPQDHDLLKEVRDCGVLTLSPQRRSFAQAQALERGGFLRAVRSEQLAFSTFVLSGKGIGVVGAPIA